MLNVLFSAARFEAESVLVLENRLPGLADTLQLAPAVDAGLCAPAAGDGRHRRLPHPPRHPRGWRKRDADDPEALIASLPPRALVVVLVGLSNHDNVGAIFRNAAAFGADAVLLDQTCCDPLYRKAIRVSVGAALKVPFAVAADAGSIGATSGPRGLRPDRAFAFGRGGHSRCSRPDRLALYLGTEGEGLPGSLLSRLKTVRIGMADGFDSLNVAAASAIALHHFSEGK